MGRGTGITGKKFRGSILVYPNPVKDDLFIRFETLTPGDFLLEIQDMTGRILMQRSYKQVAPGDILRVTSLPQAPGIYFLKLTGPGKEDPFVTLIRKTM
jgi:hypothetical protein